MKLTLKVWRQKNTASEGKLESYNLDDVSTDSSFLEMLDQLNEASAWRWAKNLSHLTTIAVRESAACAA